MFFTPRWLASHAFVAALIVAFVVAGFWQINRLNERQETNARVTARMGDVWRLEDLLAENLAADELEFRRVQVTGEFDLGDEILIANRSDEGEPGFWAWTPFKVNSDDGLSPWSGSARLIVNRGFVPRSVVLGLDGAADPQSVSANSGPVIIEGLLRLGDLDARVSEDGTQLTRPDVGTAAAELDIDSVLPGDLYIALEAQEPARTQDLPRPIPTPDLGEGPHRSYAFQWFTFATIGLIGYGLVLRRISRSARRSTDASPDAELDPINA